MFLLLGPDDVPPEMSGELGQPKDEVESSFPNQGAFIQRFFCTGPKSYSCVVVDAKGNIIDTVCKLKGVKMNYSTAKKFENSEVFESMVKHKSVITTDQLTFLRNVDAQTVITVVREKKVQFSSNKRRIIDDSDVLDTVPYGYVD